ncbi:MAG: carboxypeptidase-like regulatory domain-containing protein [Bacteroidales bacterium]|nr:carboxypeptidase-like regulatory domain-containing protein [Bacteroidales bacterium]
MIKQIILSAAFAMVAMTLSAQKMVTISGKVTDFSGKPIVSAMIEAKTKLFEMKYHAFTDKNGNYSISVDAGTYIGISCVRMADYGTSRLEFWAWNVPAHENMTINMRYDRLEVYGLNVFKIQGAHRGYSIYCRPMSLTRYLEWEKRPTPLMALAPNPDKMRVEVTINGSPAKVNMVEKVKEYAGKQQAEAFMIYTDLGAVTNKPYDEIRVTITDLENGDKGEAVYYRPKDKYID